MLGSHEQLLSKLQIKRNNSGNKMEAKLMIANRDVLQIVNNYIYGKSLHLEPLTIWKVFKFAKHYQLNELIDKCMEYLESNINIRNFMEIFHEANFHHHNQTKSATYTYMVKEFTNVSIPKNKV